MLSSGMVVAKVMTALMAWSLVRAIGEESTMHSILVLSSVDGPSMKNPHHAVPFSCRLPSV